MKHRRWLGIILVAALALAGAGWGVWFWSSVRGREFKPAAWRADLDARDGVRLAMARRLIHDGALDGKTRAEVVTLLGDPQPPGSLGPDHLVYWLARKGNRSDWLVVRLGPDGRVAECRIDRE